MSKESKVHCTESNQFNCTHVKRVKSTLHKSIPVNLMILSLNLMKYTHWNWHCSCSLLYQQPGAIEMSFKVGGSTPTQVSLEVVGTHL